MERKLVINHFKNIKKYDEIAEIISRNKSTVQYMNKRYKKMNCVEQSKNQVG